MAIHVDFDLSGVKGKDIECQAIFYSSPGGWALRDANDNYRLSPSLNYVAAQSMFKAKKDEYNVPDQSILIPIDELHLKPAANTESTQRCRSTAIRAATVSFSAKASMCP